MDESEAMDVASKFDESEEAIFDEEDNSRRRSQSPFEKSLSQKLLRKTFYGVFKLAALATRSETRFEEEEFDEVATDLRELVNRFKLLRIFFNVLHPVVSCVSLIKKVEELRQGMPRRARAQAAEQREREPLGNMFGEPGAN